MNIFRLNDIQKLVLQNFFMSLFFLSPVSFFFYQQQGLNYVQILSLESILVVFILLFEIPTGILTDKFGRKNAIVIGSSLIALQPIILLFSRDYIWFVIAFAISGIGLAFLSGTIEAFIFDYLKKKKLQKDYKKNIGSYWSSATVAMIIAPIVGSQIAKDVLPSQFKILIIMTMASMFLGIVISLFLKSDNFKNKKSESALLIFKKGLNLIYRNKSLLRIVILSIFSEPFFYILIYLAQPFLQQAGISIANLGIIFAIALFLLTISQKYSFLFEGYLGMKKASLVATILPGIIYIILALVTSPLLSAILIIILYGTIGLRNPLFSEYKNIHISQKHRASVLSIISMLVGIYIIIMRIIIGKLSEYKLEFAFILMGCLIISSSLLLRITEKHIVKV